MVLLLLLLSLCDIISVASAAGARPGTGHLNDGDTRFPGSLTLYEFANFAGYHVQITIGAADTCYNLKCFGDKISSASWDLPANGDFNSGAYLAFYTDANCSGMMHVFNISDKDSVVDLSDGSKLDNRVSAVMVLKTTTNPLGVVDGCSRRL